MKKQNLILVLAFVAFGLASCNDNLQTLQQECVDNIVYLTVFEDLPYGFDSVQVISPQNSIFKSVTHPDGELTASLFYYSDGRVVAVLSDDETTIARIFKDSEPVSEELKVEKIIRETDLRTGSTAFYAFTVSGEVVFTIAESDDVWSQNPTTRSWWSNYVHCVDRLSDQFCDARINGAGASLMCKLCGPCAVAAAASICIFDTGASF